MIISLFHSAAFVVTFRRWMCIYFVIRWPAFITQLISQQAYSL